MTISGEDEMNMVARWMTGLACALALAGCGGGGSPEDDKGRQIEVARQQAVKARADAIRLGPDTPCAEDAQCSILIFDSVEPGCNLPTRDSYKAYSLVSPTAKEAETKAAEQRTLAIVARQLQGAFDGPCPALAVIPPAPVCVANTCVLKSRLTGEIMP